MWEEVWWCGGSLRGIWRLVEMGSEDPPEEGRPCMGMGGWGIDMRL